MHNANSQGSSTAPFALLPSIQNTTELRDHIRLFDHEVGDRAAWLTAVRDRLDALQSGYDESRERLEYNWQFITAAIRAGLGIMPQTHVARVWAASDGKLIFKDAGTPSIRVGSLNAGRLTTWEQVTAHWAANPNDEVSICFNETPLLPLDADQPRKRKTSGISGLHSIVPAAVLKFYPQSLTQNRGLHVIGRMEAAAAWIAKPGNLPPGIDVKASGGFLRCGRRGNGKSYSPVGDGHADLWEAIRIAGDRRAAGNADIWGHVPAWPAALLDAVDPKRARFTPLSAQVADVAERSLDAYSDGYRPVSLETVLAGPYAVAIRASYADVLAEFKGKDISDSGEFYKWFGACLNVLCHTTGTAPADLGDDEFRNVGEWADGLGGSVAEYLDTYGDRQLVRCGMGNQKRMMETGLYTPKGCSPVLSSPPTPPPAPLVFAPDGMAGYYPDDTLPTQEPELIEKVAPITRPGMLLGILGESGAGKSFLCAALAVAHASGSDFMGLKTREKVGVIILASEGAGTIRERLWAYRQQAMIDGPLPIRVIDNWPDLKNDDARAAFIAQVQAISADMVARGWCARVGVIQIDTVTAAFGFEDENSASEVRAVGKMMVEIGIGTGTVIEVVHHKGKNGAAGARGSSAWRDMFDHAISVKAEIDAETKKITRRVLSIEKSRVGVEGVLFDVGLQNIGLGTGLYGELRETAFIKRVTSAQVHTTVKRELFHVIYDELFKQNPREMGEHVGVDINEMRREFLSRYAGDSFESKKRAWRRTKNHFVDENNGYAHRDDVVWTSRDIK